MNEMNEATKSVRGILLVDKQAGWTSFDVVNKIRGLLERKLRDETEERRRVKVGHSGTLDPFATGLLLIAVGKETKNIDNFMKLNKTYLATMKLGAASTTGDPEGEITEAEGTKEPSLNEIRDVFEGFKGEMLQSPPAFSAVKVDGVRAYKRARRGETVKIEPRKVVINNLEVISYKYPEVRFVCNVSSGTYIRVLAEDIAKFLDTDGYLEALRRTDIGTYSVDGALEIGKDLGVDEVLERLE